MIEEPEIVAGEREAELGGAGAGPIVRAAGGLVHREAPGGGREVVVIHRPRYDDWTFPKGKLHGGEDHERAALREVEEETGLRCELGEELPSVRYVDGRGRPKVVRYWMMRGRVEGGFEPTAEVDEVRWVSPEDALALLSHDHDRRLLVAAGLLSEDAL